MKQKNQIQPNQTSPTTTTASQPLREHLRELRRRLTYMSIAVLAGSTLAYGVQQHIVNVLLEPAKGQRFIYTSPGGGIDFLFRICIYTGILLGLPVIVYNVLRYIEPLISRSSKRFIILGSLASGLLALMGVLFGYFVGLPAALHFLLHQFTTIQIQPLVTIQSYLGFVIVYMVGSALLFQLPLFLILINRIKPLSPKRLLHYERWVILAAFVLAGLMNPSPNIISQLLVAGPFIVMYQLGIAIIALLNRPKRRQVTERQVMADAVPQRQLQPQPVFQTQATVPRPQTPINTDISQPRRPQKLRPGHYVDGFIRPQRLQGPLSTSFPSTSLTR